MAQHIVNAPDGTQHIINAPDNATADQVLAYAQKIIPAQANRSLTERIGSDYDKRVANAQEAVNAGVEGKQSIPETVGQSAYQLALAPLADTAAELGKSFYDTTAAPSVKAGFKQIGEAVAGSPVGDAARWVGKKYDEAAPEGSRTRRNIDAVAGTVGVGTMVAPVGDLASGLINKAGSVIADSGNTSKAAQRMKFSQDLVMPLNDTKAKQIDAVGRTSDPQGLLRKQVVQPTQEELNMAAHVSEIPEVKPGNTMQQNRNAIHDAIGAEAESLKGALQKSGVDYMETTPGKYDIDPSTTQNSFHAVLDKAVAGIPSDATLTGDAQAMATKLANKMHDFVDANDATPAGLLEARKQFDRYITSQNKKAFDPVSQNALQVAKDVVRGTANDYIAMTVPDEAVKASLQKQSYLFDALDNVDPKARAEAPTSVGRMLQKVDKALPIKNVVGNVAAKAALAGGAVAAPFVAPAATAAVGLGYGLGKVALSPDTRIAIGQALKYISEQKIPPKTAHEWLNSILQRKP